MVVDTIIRFNDNVRMIAKHKGLKIGDLERDIGKWAGYFSRDPLVHLEDAVKISRVLGESLEDIMFKDYEEEYRIQAINDRREQIKVEIALLKKELAEIGGDNG